MANFFDQFDAPAQSANFFDQFDAPASNAPDTTGSQFDAGDIAKSLGIGAAKGGIGLLGAPADLTNLAAKGSDALFGTNLQNYTQPIADYAGGGALQGYAEKATGPFYEPKTTAGQYAQTVGEFAPAVFGGPEGIATKLATRVLAPGMASEAAGQLTRGTAAEPYARVAGAVLGAASPVALSRAVSPTTIDAANAGHIATLKNAGVDALTAGQKAQSKAVQYMESELGNAIGAGGGASAAEALAKEQFTAGVLNRAGVTGASRATPEVIDDAFNANSDAFNSVAARNPVIPVVPGFWGEIGRVADDYKNLTGKESPLLSKLIGQLQNPAVSPSKLPGTQLPATISGDAYQSIQSEIARFARAATDPELKMSLRELKGKLDDAVGNGLQTIGSGADARAWQQARQQYKNLLVVERAVSGTTTDAANGIISPSALTLADKAVSGRRAYARGQSNFSDLAHAGNAMMKSLPQSGTAPRAAAHMLPMILGGALGAHLGEGGLGGALAGVAAPALAGRTIMSRPVQAYLSNQAAVPLRQIPLPRNLLTSGLLSSPALQRPYYQGQ